MKITDLEFLRMQAFTEPKNNWLFVRVHTDEGISGLGEGSLQYKDASLAAEIVSPRRRHVASRQKQRRIHRAVSA